MIALRKFLQKVTYYLYRSNFVYLPKGYMIDSSIVITEFIGEGGYALVYKGYHLKENKVITIKQIRKHQYLFYKREELVREIAMYFYLDNNLSWCKSIHQDDFDFLVLPFSKGDTLESLLFEQNVSFSVKEALQVFLLIIKKVKEIHERGIVHHDLRLPNILFDGKNITIIDFGLAEKIDHVTISNVVIQPDMFKLGHLLLFLLYSSYSVDKSKKGKTWQDELQVSDEVKQVIRKLLLLDEPYSTDDELIENITFLCLEELKTSN